MPNDCWNRITIKGTEDQILSIVSQDFRNIQSFAFKKIMFGKEILVFKLWSPWVPCVSFMDLLYNKYPNVWMLNEWREEGGNAGVLVGKKDNVSKLTWDEGCIEEWHHRSRGGESIPDPQFAQPGPDDVVHALDEISYFS